MFQLLLSLIVCNVALFYFYSVSKIIEKFLKINYDFFNRVLIGYAVFILVSYYLYFSLSLDIKIINFFLILTLFFFSIYIKSYIYLFFFTKKNFLLNLIILTLIIPALLYGEQFYIFRGNYWDSSSYLISGLLFNNYSFNEVTNNNYPIIFNEFKNIDRITTGRPLVHYLLSIFLNLKFSIFYSYYLFKSFISILIFLSLSDFLRKYFFPRKSFNYLILSFMFIFSFWNIYIFEIDALSHYASIPIFIYLIKVFFKLNDKEKLKENYFLIGIISSGLFIIYPEIFLLPVITYLIIFILKVRTIKKKELYYLTTSVLIFFILTIPSFETNYKYLFFSQLSQSLRGSDWWGYFGSFMLGKENLVLSDVFVEQLKNYITIGSNIDILKFIHYSHFSQKYYFIYLNIIPSLSGLYFLLPGQINSNLQFILQFVLVFSLIIYLITIFLKNISYIFFKNKNLSKFFVLYLVITLIILIFFFFNNNYWSIIKFYSYLFPFIFIFFAINFKNKSINIVYVFLISLFCIYKYSIFDHGIGKYDSFPSILNSSLKKEIIWDSIEHNDLRNCKIVSFNNEDYIINAYLNLKLINLNDPTNRSKICDVYLEENKFKFSDE